MREIAQKDPYQLEDAVSSFLNDAPRPGQPPRYSDEGIIKILEIACHNSEELGYESSHWRLNQLVDAVIKEGIVDSQETFAEKVNEICTVYHEAEATRKAGGHTVSVDEMTGVQALEHKYPDKPVMSGKTSI